MSLVIKAAVCNDIGYSRDNNEDNFYLDGTYLAKENMDNGGVFAIQASTECALFVVCDGMGGENKGEDASFSAIKTFDELRDELTDGKARKIFSLIDKYVTKANNTIIELVENGHAGSTMAMLCFYDDEAFCASLGDSRLYVLRDGMLSQISCDHTEAGQLVSAGVLTPAEAKGSIYKNVLTRYLGMAIDTKTVEAAIYKDFVLHYSDRFLLCSDGLSDMLEDSQIREILRKKLNPQQIARALVAKALENGGRDNITAMIVDVEGEQQSPPDPMTKTEIQENTAALEKSTTELQKNSIEAEISLAETAAEKSIDEATSEQNLSDVPVATKYIFDDDSLTIELLSDKQTEIANTIEKMLVGSSNSKGLLEEELEHDDDKLVIVENFSGDKKIEPEILEQSLKKKGLLEQQLEFQDHQNTQIKTKSSKEIFIEQND